MPWVDRIGRRIKLRDLHILLAVVEARSMAKASLRLAMPLHQQGYLTPDEVYSLTAYLLHRNGIIKEGDVMDAQSLPKVQMPNRDGYVPPPFTEWKPGLRGR